MPSVGPHLRSLLLSSGVLLFAGTAAQAQTASISTQGTANTTNATAFGHGNGVNGLDFASAVGQSFLAPTNGASVLTSFTFHLGSYYDYYNPAALRFRAYVVAWDGAANRPTGEILWQSDLQQGSTHAYRLAAPSLEDFEARTFNTGGVTLAPGQLYLAFVSSADQWAGPYSFGVSYENYVQTTFNQTRTPTERGCCRITQWGGSYTDGNLVYFHTWAPTTGPLTVAKMLDPRTAMIYSSKADQDLVFSAEFAATATDMPEPASLAMLTLGVVGVARTLRRRRG